MTDAEKWVKLACMEWLPEMGDEPQTREERQARIEAEYFRLDTILSYDVKNTAWSVHIGHEAKLPRRRGRPPKETIKDGLGRDRRIRSLEDRITEIENHVEAVPPAPDADYMMTLRWFQRLRTMGQTGIIATMRRLTASQPIRS